MNTQYMISKLISGSILKILFLVISVVIAFFMMPFLVDSLGDRYYGFWVLIGTAMGFYGFMDFGLSTAIQRFISQENGRNNIYGINVVITTALVVYLILGILVFLITCLISYGMYFFIDNTQDIEVLSKVIFILGISISLQFPVRVFGGILRSFFRQDIVTLLELSDVIIRSAFVFYFISKGHGIITLSLIVLLTNIFVYAFETYCSIKVFPSLSIRKKYFDFSKIRELYSYSWVAFLGSFADVAKTKVSMFIVTALMGPQYVVLYAISFRLLEYFERLVRNSVEMLLPVFSHIDGSSNRKALQRGFEYTLILSTLVVVYMCGSIAFYSKDFIPLWMGSEYFDSYYILLILSVMYSFMLIQLPGKQLLLGISQHRYIAVINISELVLSSILGTVFGILWGYKGVALGLSIGVIGPEIYLRWVLNKFVDTRKFYRRTLLSIFTKVSLFLILYFMVISTFMVQSYLSLFTLNVIQGIMFVPYALFYVLPVELREMLLRHTGLNARFLALRKTLSV